MANRRTSKLCQSCHGAVAETYLVDKDLNLCDQCLANHRLKNYCATDAKLSGKDLKDLYEDLIQREAAENSK